MQLKLEDKTYELNEEVLGREIDNAFSKVLERYHSLDAGKQLFIKGVVKTILLYAQTISKGELSYKSGSDPVEQLAELFTSEAKEQSKDMVITFDTSTGSSNTIISHITVQRQGQN